MDSCGGMNWPRPISRSTRSVESEKQISLKKSLSDLILLYKPRTRSKKFLRKEKSYKLTN
jgi:hypothetical protein